MSPRNSQLETLARTQDIREWRKNFIISTLCAIPLMIVAHFSM